RQLHSSSAADRTALPGPLCAARTSKCPICSLVWLDKLSGRRAAFFVFGYRHPPLWLQSGSSSLLRLAGAEPGKAVGAPFLAANALMDEEEAVGIVFLLHGGQPRIVRPPKRSPPLGLEEIAFRDVRARFVDHFEKRVHRFRYGAGGAVGRLRIGFVTSDAGIRG